MAESAVENAGANAGSFLTKNWKWILAGGAAVVALVVFTKGRAGGSALPTGASNTVAPTAPDAQSGVIDAIGQQNHMLLGLVSLLDQSRQESAQALSAYQKQVSDALAAQHSQTAQTVGPTATSTAPESPAVTRRRQRSMQQESADTPLPTSLTAAADSVTAHTDPPKTTMASAEASAASTAPIVADNGIPLVRNPGAFVPGMSNADYYDKVIQGQ